MTARVLYAIAAKNGLVEHGNRDDPFHLIIYSLTGKESAKDLTKSEMKAVEKEIFRRTNKVKNQEAVPDMMSPAQQSLAWRLMYKIRNYDLEISDKTTGERLAGVVRKTLKISASDTKPLELVTAENGNILIETLKRYAKSAEKKYMKYKNKEGFS